SVLCDHVLIRALVALLFFPLLGGQCVLGDWGLARDGGCDLIPRVAGVVDESVFGVCDQGDRIGEEAAHHGQDQQTEGEVSQPGADLATEHPQPHQESKQTQHHDADVELVKLPLNHVPDLGQGCGEPCRPHQAHDPVRQVDEHPDQEVVGTPEEVHQQCPNLLPLGGFPDGAGVHIQGEGVPGGPVGVLQAQFEPRAAIARVGRSGQCEEHQAHAGGYHYAGQSPDHEARSRSAGVVSIAARRAGSAGSTNLTWPRRAAKSRINPSPIRSFGGFSAPGGIGDRSSTTVRTSSSSTASSSVAPVSQRTASSARALSVWRMTMRTEINPRRTLSPKSLGSWEPMIKAARCLRPSRTKSLTSSWPCGEEVTACASSTTNSTSSD